MANSMGFQFRYSYERDLWQIYAKITIGAAGAPTLTQAKGISSITRVSAGLYDVVLKDNFYMFMKADQSQLFASALAAPNMSIVSEQVSNVTTPKIRVQFTAPNFTSATDPDDGSVVLLHICCRNAST